MGWAVFAVIVVLAIAAGVAVQLAERKFGYDWLVIAATATFGAYFASETFPGSTAFQTVKDWGAQVDGFYVIPGVMTAAILATVAYLGTRNLEATIRTA